MLLKLITVAPRPGGAGSFSEGQKRWSEVRNAPGLVAQLGGWGTKNQALATVVGIWRSAADYRLFMSTRHDALAAAANQAAVIQNIDVATFEHVMSMPGEVDGLVAAVPSGRLLRYADCRVRPGLEAEFMRAQEHVWRPGMQDTGMLGGAFWACLHEPGRFLVTTLWRDDGAHEKYVQSRFPELQARSDVAAQVLEIRSELVRVEASWTVLP